MLTTAADERLVVFPLRSLATFDYYKRAVASFWTVEEVDLAHDLRDWRERLSPQERAFIESVLAFFAASDGVVNENLAVNFFREVQLAEARLFYGVQIAIEGIHAEMYSLLIDTYVRDDDARKQQLLASVRFGGGPATNNNNTTTTTALPWIQRKADWARAYFDAQTRSFAERLVAFACVEGIFFSASFCAIYWLKKRGLMPGLTFSNELISRDEGLHTEFAAHLFRDLLTPAEKERASDDVVRAIVHEAALVELEFVRGALPVAVIGMNAELMSDYVRFVANRLLALLLPHNATPAFDERAQNPFDFMNMISVSSKANFFESRVSAYARAGVRTSAGSGSNEAADTSAAAGAAGTDTHEHARNAPVTDADF